MSLALVWTLRIIVGLCFGAAALGKSLEFTAFSRTVRALLGGSPARARALAVVVVGIEGCLAIYLVSSLAWLVADVAAFAWLTALAVVSVVAALRGLDIPCSCFGASAKPLGRGTLPLAAILAAAQASVVLREGLRRHAVPATAELLAIWALALAVIAAARLVAALPTLIAVVGQRRRLRGDPALP
jgi:hypothetical protein